MRAQAACQVVCAAKVLRRVVQHVRIAPHAKAAVALACHQALVQWADRLIPAALAQWLRQAQVLVQLMHSGALPHH